MYFRGPRIWLHLNVAAIKKARYSRVTKTFQTKSAAKAWAMKVEMQMDAEGSYIDEKEAVNSKSELAGDDFLGLLSVRLA